MKIQDVLPVILSVTVIILVAVIEKQNKTLAGITTVMPVVAPLALWIVYSSSGGEQAAINDFTFGMVMGIIPSLGFILAVWLAARAGMKLGPILGAGYGVWAFVAGIVCLLKSYFRAS